MELPSALATNAPTLSAAAVPVPRAGGDIDKTAADFEAFFIAQMLDTMFSGIPTDGPFSGGYAEQVYRSMLTQEFGRVMTGASNFGVADAVKREMLKMQEVA